MGALLDAYDDLNGSILLAWRPFPGINPTAYNVYVGGVLNQQVTTRQATVTGLQTTSYNAAGIAPTPANGPRPQNMPPNGIVTASGTYSFRVAALVAGVEVAATSDLTVTVNPASIMLKTSMRRLWPFPNTGLD